MPRNVAQLSRLERSVQRFEKILDGFVADVQRYVSLDAFGRTLKNTPTHLIDGGRLKANWQVTVNTQPSGQVSSTDESGRQTESKGKAVLASLPPFSMVFITNNMPYAGVVEYGGFPKAVKRGTYIPKHLRARVGDDAKVTKTTTTGKGKRRREVPMYVQFSEGGFSRQAPKGMARLAVEEAAAAFDKAVAVAVSKANAKAR